MSHTTERLLLVEDASPLAPRVVVFASPGDAMSSIGLICSQMGFEQCRLLCEASFLHVGQPNLGMITCWPQQVLGDVRQEKTK